MRGKVINIYNKQLETFISVADAGSLNKAAENMFITPTAVIKQINSLENSLNLKLFIRTNQGVILTESGKSFYNDVKYIIQYSRDSVMRARNAMNKSKNIIRIGTSLMTPGQFLMESCPNIHELVKDIKFELVPFENTPENAREILKNLGHNFDIIAGIFDDKLLEYRECAALELKIEPIRCAVSIYHPLASKKSIAVKDLYGENLMILKRGSFSSLDNLREDLWRNHPQINIIDFDFYSLDVFNRCENSNNILIAVDPWKNAHPLLKILPVEWDYTVPYGLLHSQNPSLLIKKFLDVVKKISF